MPKTREEIAHLKFEKHKEEILTYQKEMEADRKKNKLCPLFPQKHAEYWERICMGDDCAWWDEVAEQCAIRRLTELTRK